ncbi:hypothetical protein PILCRDRAFT_524720 [Piloderma croceum F 1598]|uniref:Uncharacterized protein n=1 Tax=Piloderma croceum (strain F 1598) TaxID=765440 RepID=A0A0C3B3Y8_PILCF|nr:hypothetical protein PILCRDRAFT_524720 [Piloderma croceum F 1598]
MAWCDDKKGHIQVERGPRCQRSGRLAHPVGNLNSPPFRKAGLSFFQFTLHLPKGALTWYTAKVRPGHLALFCASVVLPFGLGPIFKNYFRSSRYSSGFK